ncbi:MAG TPA: hypothetical protein VLJ59_00530 [Mycobacteriales bacterium]|nr:hypothetical protein [Mycobacteriales bacterium]
MAGAEDVKGRRGKLRHPEGAAVEQAGVVDLPAVMLALVVFIAAETQNLTRVQQRRMDDEHL